MSDEFAAPSASMVYVLPEVGAKHVAPVHAAPAPAPKLFTHVPPPGQSAFVLHLAPPKIPNAPDGPNEPPLQYCPCAKNPAERSAQRICRLFGMVSATPPAPGDESPSLQPDGSKMVAPVLASELNAFWAPVLDAVAPVQSTPAKELMGT